jgi:hypothetical protein
MITAPQARSSFNDPKADQTGATARFTAVAISPGGPRTTSGAARVDIVINRWSTDDERQRLLDALEKGQDALLETLRELKPVGYIRTPGNLGYDLHYANQTPTDERGRRIFIATDRPIGFWEGANRPRRSTTRLPSSKCE